MRENILENGYKIKEMPKDEFFKIQTPHGDAVFEEDHSAFPSDYLPQEERDQIKSLYKEVFNKPYMLCLGLYDSKENFVGWSYGFQENSHVYYMCNSGILPEHRRKGLYTELMKFQIEILKEKGFQVIASRHNATNNSIIIPKLKAGFVITNLEMCDVFGVMVHLKYYTNKTRRKIMDYRAGQKRPDDELKKVFSL